MPSSGPRQPQKCDTCRDISHGKQVHFFLICASRKGTVLKGEDTWQPWIDNTAFVLLKKKGSLWADLAQMPLTVPVTRCALQIPQLSASYSSLFISSSKLTLQGLFYSLRTELYCLTKQLSTFLPSPNMQRPKITGRAQWWQAFTLLLNIFPYRSLLISRSSELAASSDADFLKFNNYLVFNEYLVVIW